MDNTRQKVFNFKMSKLDFKIINEKLEESSNEHNSDAKTNLALDFLLQNIYVHEKVFILQSSLLLCSKTDLITLREKIEKLEEQCTQKTPKHKMEIQIDHKCETFSK